MPPSATVIVRQANGQSLVLSGDDRIVKEVTVPCSSQRCASRHGQESPVTFTFNDQDPFPETGDQFLSLILPERSPSNPQFPLPFCGPQCLKDYLVYQYLAPGPRANYGSGNPETLPPPVAYPAGEYIGAPGFGGELVRKTDNELVTKAEEGSFAAGVWGASPVPITDNLPEPLTMKDVEYPNNDFSGGTDYPRPVAQADGSGE